MIIVAILFPTIYFLLNKQLGRASATFILFVIGCGFIMFVVPAIICWLIASFMAVMHLKNKRLDARVEKYAQRQAELIGREVRKGAS
jgi:drug/metabolite transporter (DMT)-like permease